MQDGNVLQGHSKFHPPRNGELYANWYGGIRQWEYLVPMFIANGVCHSAVSSESSKCRSLLNSHVAGLSWFGIGGGGDIFTEGLSDMFAEVQPNDLVDITFYTLDPGYKCYVTSGEASVHTMMLYLYGQYSKPYPSSSGRSWSNAIRVNNIMGLGGVQAIGTDPQNDGFIGSSVLESGKAGVSQNTRGIPKSAYNPLDWNKHSYKIDLKRKVFEFLLNDKSIQLLPYPFDNIEGIEFRHEYQTDDFPTQEFQCPSFLDEITLSRTPQ
jgi:hypothetical protein